MAEASECTVFQVAKYGNEWEGSVAGLSNQLGMKQTSPLPKGSSLSKFVSGRIESLSKSQREVAQYIVDHLEEVAFQTAEELARRVSTSSSTVVRFSQNLGFEGFPELQQAAREEYRRKARNESKNGNGSDKVLFNIDQSEFEAAMLTDHVNVEETAVKISAERLEATSKAIVKAGRVIVISLDQMAFFQKLQPVGNHLQ